MALVASRPVFNKDATPPSPAMRDATCIQTGNHGFQQIPPPQSHCYPQQQGHYPAPGGCYQGQNLQHNNGPYGTSGPVCSQVGGGTANQGPHCGQYQQGPWDSAGRQAGLGNFDHTGASDGSLGYHDNSTVDPTPKRLRGSYRCRRCGQPKKGHVCPSGSSPSVDGSHQYSPSSSQGAQSTPGQHQSTAGTPGSSVHPSHSSGASAAQTGPTTFPQQSFTSPTMVPGSSNDCGMIVRPSAAALGILPTRLSGLGMSPQMALEQAGVQRSSPGNQEGTTSTPPSYPSEGHGVSTPSPNGFSLSHNAGTMSPPQGYSSLDTEHGEQKPSAEWASQQMLPQGTPSAVNNSAMHTPMTGHYSVGPSPGTAHSGSHVVSVLQRVLSMSSLMKPPTFDEFGIQRSATFAGFQSSPSQQAGEDEEKPKPQVVKRSEQDMCMLNILAKLLPSDLLAAAQCCRRWRRLAADVWFSVESATLVLDETKRPSEYVPFVLRKSPKLSHLTLVTRRWVLDDQLLLRIATERPSLLSLVIRPDPDIDCRITEFGLSAFVRGCGLLEKVEIGNSFRMGGVQLQSYSLRSLSLFAATSLSHRFSLSCPSLVELSLSFFSAHTLAPASPEDAAALAQRSGNSTTRESMGQITSQISLIDHAPSTRTQLDLTSGSGSEGNPCDSSITVKTEEQQAMFQVEDLPVHASRRRVNAVLQQVANMSNPLKRLHVASLHTSDVMVSGLLAAHAQSLRAVSFTHSQSLTDEGVNLIAMSCKNLEFLDVSGCTHITDAALEHICEHLAPSLNRLLLAGCAKLTARALERAVARLPHLAVLDLGFTLVSEEQFQSSATTEGSQSRTFGQPLDSNRDVLRRSPTKETSHSSGVLVWEGGSPWGRITQAKRKWGEGEGEREGKAAEDLVEKQGGEGKQCALNLKSSSLQCLSLWGCSALEGIELNCRGLKELNLNHCTGTRDLDPAVLRQQCPHLRKVLMQGLGGGEGGIEEDYEEDYEEGETYV